MVVSLLTLASFVKVFQAMFLGPPLPEWREVREAPFFWVLAMAVLAAATVAFGLFPDFVMDRMLRPAADALVDARGFASALLPGGAP